MFTGIVEAQGIVDKITKERSNIHFDIRSPISNELKIDQSIAHDGVCLTVVDLKSNLHRVTAIEETLVKSNLGQWIEGSSINLERCMKVGARLDGHFVQGHVDHTGICEKIENRDGSWNIAVSFDPKFQHLIVDKGSICINGVSLTVVEANPEYFSISIIPYTWEHTNFSKLKVGSIVNLEFDILGKYISKIMDARLSS